MAVRNIAELRASAPEEYKSLSDRDLVEVYSAKSGMPFAEAADYFRIPKTGTLREMGGQFAAGLTVDAPRMVGQALDYYSGGGNQFAQRMIEGAERRGLTAQTDPRGRGAIRNDALIAGARGLGPVAATLATSVLPGGQVIAPALAAATFGGSGAYETYQRVFDETGDAAAASAAARRAGLLQGGGEAIATAVGGRLIRPLTTAVRGAPTTARVVDAMTDTRVLRPLARGVATNTAVQVGTEIGQDVGTSLIESAYGAQDEDLGQIAYQSGMAAAGMSLLLGGFSVGGYRARARRADRIQKALDGDPSVAPEDRARILGVVNQEAERRGVSMTDRETWVREQLLPAEQRKNETLDRMEQIRAEIALTDRNNTQGREALVAEFRKLYDAPSGERAPAEDGVEVELTNGQLMAREITAMREQQRTEQQTQRDPDAEIDITQAPAVDDRTANAQLDDEIFNFLMVGDELGTGMPSLEQLQSTDVTTLPADLQRPFQIAVQMAGRKQMSHRRRAEYYRDAIDILETASPADANAMGMGWVIPREGVSALAAPPALTEQEQAATQMGRQQQALESIDLLDTDIEAQETPPFVIRGQEQAFDQVQQQQPVEDETLTGAPRITAMTPEAETQMDRQRAALRDIEQTQPTNTPTVAQMEQQEQGRLRGAFDQVMQRSQDLDTQEVVQAQRRFPVPAGQVETGTPTPPAQQIAPAQDRMFSRATDAELERVIAAEDTVPYRRRMARAELERRQPAPVEPAPVVAAQRAPDAEQRVPAEPVADADIEIDTEEELAQIDTLFKNLNAEVEGADAPKSTGRVSLPKAVLIAIRNAILNPDKKGQTVVRVPGTTAIDEAATAQYQPRIAKIARATNKFADSYDAIITKARNLVSAKDKEFRGSEQEMSEINAILRVGADAGVEFAMYDEIRNASPAVQAWFKRRVKGTSLNDLIEQHEIAKNALLEEFGTDTKNIDAIVRMVKDRAQARLNKGSVDSATYKRLRKIDLTLSRGWNAARRGVDTTEQLFDVRSSPTRAAKEARDQRGPLVMALEGVNAKGKESGPGGIVGVMDYYTKNGTVYEKTLARAIRAVVINMGDNAPTMKLKAGDKPSYNPANNTITIGTDASASVVLHESLHGALQWYVYNNQNSPQVAALIEAVKKVIEYNGNLSAKAQEVQNVLKKLMTGKDPRVLDAVLELVSYGNTLNEFRIALDQMPTTGTPLTLRENANKVWRSILNVVNTMLGVKPNATLANDVIKNTFMLLEGAANPESVRGLNNVMQAGQQEGKTLYATVTGTDMPSRDADASTGQYQRAMPQKNLEKFNKKILPEWMSSKFLFDAYGGWWGNTMKAIDEKVLSNLSASIQKTSPKLTTVIKWVNNNYGLQGAVADLMLRAKDDRRGGSIQVEVLTDHLASLPTEITRKVLASLDARLDALRKGEVLPPIEGIDRKTGIDLLANDMLDRWWEYARTTRDDKLRDRMAGVYNPKTKQWEGGVKFSQGLIVPDTLKNIVSPTFGEQALSKFTKPRSKTELNEDAIMMRTDSNGDPVLTDKFIGLYQLDAEYQKARKEGTPMASLEPHAFISVERFLAGERPTWNGLPMDFDNAYMWTLERKGDKGYKLTAQLDLSSAAAAKSSQQIAAAIQNTMGILANSYSATRLTDSLYAHGRGTPNAVAYDNLDELNSVLQGKYVNDKFEPQTDRSKWANQVRRDNVLKAEERGAEAVRDKFNISNSWVRVPDNPTYGALRNKIVQGSVWNAVQDAYDTRPVIALQQANTIMRWFKKAKTQYNPATWGTNVATNFTMAMMDDIPMQTIATASRLYFGYMLPENIKKKLGVNINLTREEQELMAGVLGTNALIGTVSTAELRQDVFEAMRDSFGGQELSVPSRIMQLMGMEKRKLEAFEKRYGAGKEYAGDRAAALDKFASDWYAAQDNVFRVASMLNKLGQMKSEGRVIDAEAYRVAGDHARFAFLDYDIDSKAVKLMRQTAFPFISWPYAAAKLIGHVAVHKPWKLVNLYAGYWMLDALLQTITGDEEEELRKAGPEWARDRMFFGMGPHTHLRVPFLGDDENPVYYNLGKYIAPSSFGETVPNPFLGLDWWPSFITPGGPFISSALIITAGVDPFTGDKISPPTASAWEAAGDRVGMVQSMFTPNVPFISATETTKFFEAMTARTDRSENYDDLYLARLAGLRFYDFNVDGARQAQSRAAQAIRRDFDVQISRLRRSMLRHEEPDYDKFFREREKLRARLDERLAELTGDDNNL